MIIELSMCDADRERLGGPEWVRLDTGRVMDTPARDLIRWEAECGYPIERAISDIDAAPPATATLILLWLARKQGGDPAGGIDEDTGRPEQFRRLLEVRTLRVRIRRAEDVGPATAADPEGDAVPPEPSPAN